MPRGSSAQISDSRHGKHGQGVLDTENCSFNLTVERTVNWSVPTGSRMGRVLHSQRCAAPGACETR